MKQGPQHTVWVWLWGCVRLQLPASLSSRVGATKGFLGAGMACVHSEGRDVLPGSACLHSVLGRVCALLGDTGHQTLLVVLLGQVA